MSWDCPYNVYTPNYRSLLVGIVFQTVGSDVIIVTTQVHHRRVIVLRDFVVIGIFYLHVVLVGLVVVILDFNIGSSRVNGGVRII